MNLGLWSQTFSLTYTSSLSHLMPYIHMQFIVHLQHNGVYIMREIVSSNPLHNEHVHAHVIQILGQILEIIIHVVKMVMLILIDVGYHNFDRLSNYITTIGIYFWCRWIGINNWQPLCCSFKYTLCFGCSTKSCASYCSKSYASSPRFCQWTWCNSRNPWFQ